MLNAPADSPPSLQRPGRSIWLKGLALGLAIFVFGFLFGGSTVGTYYMKRERELFFMPKNMPDALVESLTFELGLSDAQHAEVLGVFREHHSRMETLRAKIQPEVDMVMDSVRVEIAKILNEAQLRLWDTRFEQMRARFRSKSPAPNTAPDPAPDEIEPREKVAP